MEAYCLKCRTKRDMKDEKQITMKNGKPATEGICPTCGTRMFKIGAGAAKEEPVTAVATKTKAKTAAKAPAKAATATKAPAKAPAKAVAKKK